MQRRKKAQNIPEAIDVGDDSLDLARPEKVYRLQRPDTTQKIVLERILNEFENKNDSRYSCRFEEMIEMQQKIELNLSNGSDAVLDVVAQSLEEGLEITEKVLSDHFGFSDKSSGGDDPRLFVLTYQAKDVRYEPSVLFERIKCDLKSLIQMIPFKQKDAPRK